MIDYIAILIGYAIMLIGAFVVLALTITAGAWLANFAIRQALDAYGGWEVFLQFRKWYHDNKQ